MVLIVVILAMLALLFLSLPVAAALTYLGFFLDGFYSSLPLHRGLATMSWAVQSGILLVAVPMFILLGEILVRSGIAERMYRAMMQWLSWLPGGEVVLVGVQGGEHDRHDGTGRWPGVARPTRWRRRASA